MKVLIIGLGSIARKHIAALRSIDPAVEIYALRRPSSAPDREGVHTIFHLDEMEALEIDFAIISNPTALHSASIKDLLQYSIPLFIEKPVFADLGHEDLLSEITKKEIPTYIACNLRFLESLAFTKEFIGNKRINEVNIYCGSYLPEWRPGQDYKESYSARQEMGGGVHIDLIHEIDYAVWLFGKPDEVSRFTSNDSSLSISAADYANFYLKYPYFSASIILNYYRRDARRTLEVVCEDGTLTADLLANQVSWKGEIAFQSNKTIHDTYSDQLQHFIKQVLNQSKSFNDINEAYETLKICLTNDFKIK